MEIQGKLLFPSLVSDFDAHYLANKMRQFFLLRPGISVVISSP